MKNDNEILLTIGIPTFNRCECLKELLAEIVKQSYDLQAVIEVVVSDNASTDSTKTIVAHYSTKSSNLKIVYYKNTENIGIDKNIELLVSRSFGKYLWILCDDDLPAPNAIAKIYNMILNQKEFEITLFFINRSIQNLMMTEVIMEREHKIYDDIKFKNGLDLFDRFKDSVLTASCLVLKRDCCIGIATKKFLTGFYCSPMVLALEAMSHGEAYFISSPLVIYREGDKSSWAYLWSTIYFYNIPFILKNLAFLNNQKNTFNVIIETKINDPKYIDFIYLWKFSRHPQVIDYVNWLSLLSLYKDILLKKPKILLLILLPPFILRIKIKIDSIKGRVLQQIN